MIPYKIFLLLIFLTFNIFGMKRHEQLVQQNAKNPREVSILLLYKLALLRFELPTKEKPFQELQIYALAYPEDPYSQTIESFTNSCLDMFAETAHSLRSQNALPTEIGPELQLATDKLLEDKESMQQLIQMHNHAKKQMAKERVPKKLEK